MIIIRRIDEIFRDLRGSNFSRRDLENGCVLEGPETFLGYHVKEDGTKTKIIGYLSIENPVSKESAWYLKIKGKNETISVLKDEDLSRNSENECNRALMKLCFFDLEKFLNEIYGVHQGPEN